LYHLSQGDNLSDGQPGKIVPEIAGLTDFVSAQKKHHLYKRHFYHKYRDMKTNDKPMVAVFLPYSNHSFLNHSLPNCI
jgi:peptide methionine sulfoxide reductase MsrA